MRTRELAVRSALGAGRRRLLRELLTESLVLSVLGGVFGLGLGAWILNAAPALIPPGLLPSTATLSFDARVIAVVALTGAASVAGPAWRAARIDPATALRGK